MDKHFIGENAGIVWRFLNSNSERRWEFSEVKEGTGLDDLQLSAAIGWLARENKIQFELEHHNKQDRKAYIYLMVNVYI